MRTLARDRGDWTRTITGRVTSAGALTTSSEPVTVTRFGVGQYTVRLVNASRRVLATVANSEAASFLLCTAGASDPAGAMIVNVWNSSAGTAADAQFSFSMTVADR